MAEPGYAFAKSIIKPWLRLGFRTHVEGREHLPAKGPVIIAANHVSLFDPLAVAYAIDSAGRRPRFLGKASLFSLPVVGWILRSAGQVPVERGTRNAVASLVEAENAVASGECVVIFPEGTATKSDDLSPLPPKTGISRLALKTKAPVIPCATWGGQWVWGYHVGFRPGVGKDVWVRFGPPLNLDDFSGGEEDPQAWDELASMVMKEIGLLLVGLQTAKPWLPRPLPSRARRRSERKGRAE